MEISQFLMSWVSILSYEDFGVGLFGVNFFRGLVFLSVGVALFKGNFGIFIGIFGGICQCELMNHKFFFKKNSISWKHDVYKMFCQDFMWN